MEGGGGWAHTPANKHTTLKHTIKQNSCEINSCVSPCDDMKHSKLNESKLAVDSFTFSL